MPLQLKPTLAGLLTHHVHHFATLWRIQRVDGVTFRFTDHDTELPFSIPAPAPLPWVPTPTSLPVIGAEEIYVPAGGFNASAREKQAGIRDSNLEAIGVITADAITDEDLRAGKYDEAQIVEMLVDYRYPYEGYLQRNDYWIAQVAFSQDVWQAQISGQPVWLRKEIGGVLSRDCRHQFGKGICGKGINLEALRVAGSVSTVVERRRVFMTSLSGEDEYFTNGEITWTSGANIGLKDEIFDFDPDGKVTLPLQTRYEVVAGDAFTIVPGCLYTFPACVKWANVINFGGFEDMPGSDKVIGGLVL